MSQEFVLPLVVLCAVGAGAPSASAQPGSDRNPEPFQTRIEHELGAPGGLTAEGVARRAVATSSVLEARRAELTAASAEVDRAFAAYIPKLDLLARYTRFSRVDEGAATNVVVAPGVLEGPVDPTTQPLFSVPLLFNQPLNQYTLQASLTIPVSDYFLRVANTYEGTRAAEDAAQKSVAASELSAVADAKTAYYAWVRAKLSSIVATHALEDARGHLRDVQNAIAAGMASRADELAIEARVAESELLVESSQNLALELGDQLRILQHDPPEATYRIGETLAGEPAGAPRESLAVLTQTALAQRPELAALELRARSVRAMASVEHAGSYPRLDLFAIARYENPNSRVFPPVEEFKASWDAGAQLSWTITDILGALASGRSQNAAAKALSAERRAFADQIRGEVSAAYRALLVARASIRTSARSLAAAEESHRARRALFQNGRATGVEVMDAELELTRARLLAVTARIDLEVARVRLDYALGRNQKRSAP